MIAADNTESITSHHSHIVCSWCTCIHNMNEVCVHQCLYYIYLYITAHCHYCNSMYTVRHYIALCCSIYTIYKTAAAAYLQLHIHTCIVCSS